MGKFFHLTFAVFVLIVGTLKSVPAAQATSDAPAAQAEIASVMASAVQVAAGGEHTCVLTNLGGVRCWGNNNFGQLGDGTVIHKSAPVDVRGLSSGVNVIASGDTHTCALTNLGGVKCWGNNYGGQLGDGTTFNKSMPMDVSGLSSGITAITAGGYHTCALTNAGGVKCWGDNSHGQLGDGTTTDKYMSVDVSGLSSGASAIAAGWQHTCALITNGGVKCWGANFYGELGDGTRADKSMLVAVSGLSSGISAIVAGYGHTCALTSIGGIKCWGANYSGQLGDGTTTDKSSPAAVIGLSSNVSTIAAGYNHTCALISSGGVKCWGANFYGELGDGTVANKSTPIDVSGLSSGVSAIAAGIFHTCALTNVGGVKCWGNNNFGQLGDGTTGEKSTPVAVIGMSSSVSAIVAGGYHTCALTSGRVKCWGLNSSGQLGDETTTTNSMPVDVIGLDNDVSAIAAGEEHTCALTSNGGVKCWGRNNFGQLGDGTTANKSMPMDVSDLSSGIRAIVAGGYHTCALATGGGVKCWGSNYGGQLGDGTTTNKSTPVDVTGLSNGVSAIAAGYHHTCALTSIGGVKCWGVNFSGQLGDGTIASRLTPMDVSGLSSGVGAIAAGYGHTCALTSSGGVKCWGSNSSGQLGDGTTTYRLTPVAVSGLTNGVSAIAAGFDHTCALTSSGGVKCWGSNSSGQLGDGTTTYRLAPVAVSGLSSGISAIAAGDFHICALATDGGVKCWGSNYGGQLGDGTAWRNTPVDVVGFGNTSSLSVQNTAPTSDGISSPVMRGGTAFRHFRVLNGSTPVAGASVQFSKGSATPSDAQGYLTYTVPASTFGNIIGSYDVVAQSLSAPGVTTTTLTGPSFKVNVTERRYTHSWSLGTSSTGGGGLMTGIIAYVQGTQSGGIRLALDESDPDITTDDRVKIKTSTASEIQSKLGLGIERKVLVAEMDASIALKAKLRNFNEINGLFDQPYDNTQRAYQGAMLLTGIADVTVAGSNPLIFAMLDKWYESHANFPYLESHVSGQGASIGAGVSTGGTIKLKGSKTPLFGIELVNFGATLDVESGEKIKATEYVHYTKVDEQIDLDFVGVQIWRVNLGSLFENHLAYVTEWAFVYDSASNQLKRLEITLTGKAAPTIVFSQPHKDLSIKFEIPATQLAPNFDQLVKIGSSVSSQHLMAALQGAGDIPFEITVEDGSSKEFSPELDIPLGPFTVRVGLGAEKEELRELVRKRGIVRDGRWFVTEEYVPDEFVARSGKTWSELATNPLHLFGDAIAAKFTALKETISELGGTISTYVHDAGNAIIGGIRVIFPPGILPTSVPIEVAAWQPSPAGNLDSLNGLSKPNIQTALGAGFVVGGIYDLKPYTLTLSSPAQMVITYTEQAVAGIDETQVRLFRWNSAASNWQILPAQQDAKANSVTAQVSQLGTFALGVDTTAPQIKFTSPVSGSVIYVAVPMIAAMLSDVGAGIDPATVSVKVDGTPITATYIAATGELYAAWTTSPTVGTHRVDISANDIVGNNSAMQSVFTIKSFSRIYMPIVRK